MNMQRRFGKQAGIGLIEVVIAIGIMAAVINGYTKKQIELARQQADKTSAQYVLTLQAGVNGYINNNRAALLASATPTVAGFANPMAPTVAELSTAGAYLPIGFTGTNNVGMTFANTLVRYPIACTPTVNCTDVGGFTYSTASFLDADTGLADNRRVGGMADFIGDDGAFSPQSAPTTLLGATGTWVGAANPAGAQPGILVARVGFGSVGYANLDYLLPRDGTKPMTGNLNLAGHDINNVGTLNAATAVDVKDASSCIRSQLDNQGGFYSRAAGCVLSAALTNTGLVFYNGAALNTVSMNSGGLAMTDTGVGIQKVGISPAGTVAVTDGNVQRAQMAGTGTITGYSAGGAQAVVMDANTSGGAIATNGLSPASIPGGYVGGVRATDVVAGSNLAAWDGTTIQTSMSVNGKTYARDVAEVGNALQLNNVVTENTPCAVVGQQSRNSTGALLSCVNDGTIQWRKSGLVSGTIGQPCAPNGQIAQDPANNTLLCRKGFYALFNDYVPSVVDVDSLPVAHNQVVVKPACGVGGTASLLIANGTSQSDPSGILNVFSLDLGSYWQVQITTGSGLQAGPAPLMTARVACLYP